jgi:hypothetical protein
VGTAPCARILTVVQHNAKNETKIITKLYSFIHAKPKIMYNNYVGFIYLVVFVAADERRSM